MRIGDLLRQKRPCISFEFFPPQTDDGVAKLMATVKGLRILNPGFVSVTYGAGGSSRARTVEVTKRIKTELEIESMAHVTCVGHGQSELRGLFEELERAGIENIMALRGDPPRGTGTFVVVEGGLRYASDLIAMLKAGFPFCVGGACYPEKHPEAASLDADLAALSAKVRAGAEFLVTQLFFDNARYFEFVERAHSWGITVPILPGIMPITNYDQIDRFTRQCGATIPPSLRAELELRRDDANAIVDLGVAYMTLQVADLLARGAPGVHFYTLNRSPATRAVVSALMAARRAW